MIAEHKAKIAEDIAKIEKLIEEAQVIGNLTSYPEWPRILEMLDKQRLRVTTSMMEAKNPTLHELGMFQGRVRALKDLSGMGGRAATELDHLRKQLERLRKEYGRLP